MNKKELIEAVARTRGTTPEAVAYDIASVYDAIFAIIVEEVAKGKVVEIPQFGVFHRSERHLGRTRVPSTKKIPDFFSPDFAFRDAVSGAKTTRKEMENDR